MRRVGLKRSFPEQSTSVESIPVSPIHITLAYTIGYCQVFPTCIVFPFLLEKLHDITYYNVYFIAIRHSILAVNKHCSDKFLG